MKNYYMVLLCLTVSSLSLWGQQYELQLVNIGGGMMAVQARETTGGANTPSTSDGYTNISFGVSWPASCGGAIDVDVRTVSPGVAGTMDYSISRNLDLYDVGTDKVRTFSSPSSFTFFPENWMDNTFVTIATLEVSTSATTGFCDFCLVPDNLTDNSGAGVSSNPDITMAYSAHPTLPQASISYEPIINNGKASMVPLPVELLSFTATNKDTYVNLAWESVAEIDFDGYWLERSEDGKTFKEVAWLEGEGTAVSASSYNYQDKDIEGGKTYYYRLAMYDLDGSMEYSEIEAVKTYAKYTVEAFPKPTRDFLNVHISSEARTPARVHLVDICGRIVHEEQLEVERGENEFILGNNNIPNGVYMLIVRGDTWQHAEEVVFIK